MKRPGRELKRTALFVNIKKIRSCSRDQIKCHRALIIAVTFPFPMIPIRRLTNILVSVGLLIVLFTGGCRAVVEMPASPENPETVYLADNAYHAALVLPVSEDRWVRYEFGEWHYFGRNRTSLFYMIHAIAWPTDGTVGRRYIENKNHNTPLSKRLKGAHIFRLTVPRKRVRALLTNLNAPFHRKENGKVKNRERNLTVVRVNANYWFYHDSNAEVEDWLRTLGCEVYGSSFLSNWKVQKKDQPAP